MLFFLKNNGKMMVGKLNLIIKTNRSSCGLSANPVCKNISVSFVSPNHSMLLSAQYCIVCEAVMKMRRTPTFADIQ